MGWLGCGENRTVPFTLYLCCVGAGFGGISAACYGVGLDIGTARDGAPAFGENSEKNNNRLLFPS